MFGEVGGGGVRHGEDLGRGEVNESSEVLGVLQGEARPCLVQGVR